MRTDREVRLIGLRRAGLRLVIRSALALVVWAPLVWAVTPVLNELPPNYAIFGVIAIILAIPGVSIGHAVSRNLREIAGMASILLTVASLVFLWAVIVAGVRVAHQLRPIDDWQAVFTTISTGVWASLWSIRNALLDR